MNKTELVAKVAKKAKINQKTAMTVVEVTFETIIEALTSGDKVNVAGFGAFSTHKRAERVGHNPRTLEAIKLPASTVPSFKASKNLKEAINE